MTRRDDIVTIVIDAKNEIKKSVAGLDGRVNDLERGLRADLVHEVEGLRKAPLERDEDISDCSAEERLQGGSACG